LYEFLDYKKMVKTRKEGPTVTWNNEQLQKEVLDFFSNHIMPGIESHEDIVQINRVIVAGYAFQADPCDNRHRNMNEGRHDWSLVHLQGKAFDSVPVKDNAMHVIMFFEITDENIKGIDKDLVQINGKGVYALGHILATGRDPLTTNYQPVQPKSKEEVRETLDYDMWKRAKRDREKFLEESATHTQQRKRRYGDQYKPDNVKPQDRARYERYSRGHAQSRLIMRGQKLCHTNAKDGIHKPRLCVIPVSSITGTTIAVPNLQHRHSPGIVQRKANKNSLIIGEALDQSYLFIAGKDMWCGIMKRWVRNPT
jgi:hypothetical protein